MIDFDIGDKASFESKTIELSISVKAGLAETHQHDLHGSVFCIDSVEWKYSVDPGSAGDYGWPKIPQRITITDVFSDKTSSPQKFSPPILIRALDINVINPAAIPVTTNMVIQGTLVSPVDGLLPSDKDILSYVSLSPSQRGLLAINNQMILQMNQRFAALSDQFTDTNPAIAVSEPKALTDTALSKDVLRSILIGDLVTCDLSSQLDSDTLQLIADHLISLGWVRN